MDIDRRLRAHMDTEVSAFPPPDLGEIMDRGDTIRRRRRMAATVLPAAAIVVVVAGMVASRQGEPDPSIAEAVDEAAELSMDVGALDWSTGPGTLGFSRQQLTSDGIMYALSTAPGAKWENFPNGNVPQAIYTSPDGSSWASHPVGGSWVSSIAASDGLLYAVGTAPGAEADSVTVQVGISDDLGDTFETVPLPIERTGPGVIDADVMVAGDGILAVATSRTSLDPVSLLPPGIVDGNVEPIILEEGIAVVPFEAAEAAYESCFGGDPGSCQEVIEDAATYYATWEELGVAAADVSFGETVSYSAFWSGDGQSFEEIEYPFPDGFIEQVFPVGESAVAAVSNPGGTQLFASDDARTWRQVAAEVPLGWVMTIGETAGQVVAVSQPPNGMGVSAFQAPDLSGPWEEIPLAELLPESLQGQNSMWVSAAAVGEGGVAVSLSIEGTAPAEDSNPISRLAEEILNRGGPEPAGAPTSVGALVVSTDLTSWSVVPTSDVGQFVDFLTFAPDGDLIAQATRVDNGRAVRVQATATP